MGIVYPLLGIAVTGSPAVAGWVGFAWVAPGVLSYLPAGMLVDRRDPRSVVLWCEAGRALTLVLVVAALLGWAPSLPILLAAAAAEGTVASVQSLAETALLRSVVPGERLTEAVSRIETTNHAAVLGGRSLGGAIFAFAHVAPFLANLLLRALSLGLVFQISGTPVSVESRPRITGGFRALSQTPLWRSVILLGFTNIIAQALIILFLAYATQTGISPLMIGLILAASGGGGAIGAMVAPRVCRRIVSRTSVMLVYAWTWVAILFIAAAGAGVLAFAAAMLLTGLVGAVGNVSVKSYTVRTVSPGNLAQVLSAMALLSFGAFSLGPPIGGLMTSALGTGGAAWALFAAMIPAAFFVTVARVRRIGLHPQRA